MTLPAGFVLDNGSSLPQGFVVDEKEVGIGEKIAGGLEAAATMGSSIIAEPIAGLAGLATAMNPFAEEGAGARRVEQVREALTYSPELPGAKAALSKIGGAIQPVAETLSDYEKTLGNYVLEKTGSPELAAIAHTLPAATLEMLGVAALGKGKSVKNIADIEQAKKAAVGAVKEAEDLTGIRQMTTDVLPPDTRMGKFMQQQGELIGGQQRAIQQAERVKAVDNLLANYDVTEAARFERNIVDSVKRSVDQAKSRMADLYDKSTKQLDVLGNVDLGNTKKYAQKVIDRENLKGTLADKPLIDDMTRFIESPNDLSFETVKSVRSAVGNKLRAAKQGAPVQGSSDVGMLSQLYKNISDDMKTFANNADPELAKKWKRADMEFSGFATGSNKTGAKRLIKDGDATPEIVDQLLFSNKKSDMDFLNKNLDNQGKFAARQRILQRALQKSSPDGVEINPNRFQTQLDRMRSQVDTFFTPTEKSAIDSLKEALSDTRRAQDAAVSTPTGQQTIPLLAWIEPTVLIPGVAQAIIERPSIRNLLIKRKAAKAAQTRGAIDEMINAEIQASGIIGSLAPSSLRQDDQTRNQ